MTTGPKIQVSADVGGVRRELESLDRTVRKINESLNSGQVGLDTAEAQKNLAELERHAKAVAGALSAAGNKPLGDLGGGDATKALERARQAAKDLDAALRQSGSPTAGLSAQARQAREVEEGLRRATRAQEILGREGINLTRQQAHEARTAYDRLRSSGARGTRRLQGQEFEDWVGGGWRNHSLNPAEAQRHRADVLRHLGIEVPHGAGRAGAARRGRAGRLGGAAAGAIGGVASGMLGSGDGGLWGATGNMAGAGLGAAAGFAMGGPAGAAVGLIASQLLGGLGAGLDGRQQAIGDEGSTLTDLRQALGATSTDFELLRGNVRHFTEGLGVAYNEAAKLSEEFARTAALTGDAQTIGPELRAAIGFGRGYGVAPGAAAQFMASMRHVSVTRDVGDSRRLALMIGEAVNRGGVQARMGEVLQTLQQFASNAARASLSAPNVDGYASFLSTMTGLKMPGMKGDPAAAAALMGQADSAMRQGGAFGDASKNFSLGLWQRMMPGFSALDMDFVNEQGAFGTVAGAFGASSPAYQFAAKRGDHAKMAAYSRMATQGGSRSILEHQMRALEQFYGGNTDEFRSAIQSHFGVGAGQAAALYQGYTQNGGLGSLEATLRASGADVDKMNTRQVASLAALAGADSGTINAQASKLLELTGADALSKEEREQLEVARGSEKLLRDVVLKLSATHDTSTDQGDQMRRLQADMNNAMQKLATELIPLTMWVKDGILELVKALPGETDFEKRHRAEQQEIREAAAEAGRMDVDIGTLRRQIDNFQEDSPEARQQKVDGLVRLQQLRNAAADRGDTEQVDNLDRAIAQMQGSIRAGSAQGRADLIRKHNEAVSKRGGIEAVPSRHSPVDPATGAAPTAKGAGAGGLTPDEKAFLAETDRLLGAAPGTSEAQIQVESGGNPNAVSRAGAWGLAQLMPATRAELERRLGRKIESRQDQLLAHRMVMQENLGRFGNMPDALRAYNGGWDPSGWDNAETSAYVGKIERERDGFDGRVPAGGMVGGSGGQQNVHVTVGIDGSLKVTDGQGRETGQEVPLSARVGAPRPYGG